MARTWFRDDIGSVLAERTALLAAVASTGRTYSRSLMPRTNVGQAVATGLTGSVSYDYRSDLARFDCVAFDVPCSAEELAAVEDALRRRELDIAESRLVAEHVSALRSSIQDKLTGWAIEAPVIDSQLKQEARRRDPTASMSGP